MEPYNVVFFGTKDGYALGTLSQLVPFHHLLNTYFRLLRSCFQLYPYVSRTYSVAQKSATEYIRDISARMRAILRNNLKPVMKRCKRDDGPVALFRQAGMFQLVFNSFE